MGTRLVRSLTALCSLCAAPASAAVLLLNEYLDNPSWVANLTDLPQLSPIGEIEVNEPYLESGKWQRRYGTGFIVSPCYLITNAHVVFGQDMQPTKGHNYDVTFRIGASKVAPFLGETQGVPVIWGAGDANDWALVRMKTCIGAKSQFGWFEPTKYLPRQALGRWVLLAGYKGAESRGSLSISVGKLIDIESSKGNILHSASMNSGQSGGVLLIRESGSLKLACINVLSHTDSNRPGISIFDTYKVTLSNECLTTSFLYSSQIKSLIDSDKNGLENPYSLRSRLPFIDDIRLKYVN